MASKDDLKVKVAELSTEMRFIAKAVGDQGTIMKETFSAQNAAIKELTDSVKKLAEGLQADVAALKIWQAKMTQKDDTNVSWWLKVEYYVAAFLGVVLTSVVGAIAWIGKFFLGAAHLVK